jgi:hypothetical protein
LHVQIIAGTKTFAKSTRDQKFGREDEGSAISSGVIFVVNAKKAAWPFDITAAVERDKKRLT